MKNADRVYFRQFGAAMLAYAVVLFASIFLLRQMAGSPWRFAFAVLPVVPMAYGMRAVLQRLNRMDELQQRVQLQALAFACGLTALTTFTLGFLENAGLPRLSWIWILPLISVYWGVGIAVAERRYR